LLEKRAGPWRGVAYLVAEDLGDLDLLTEVGRDGLSDRRCAQVTEIFVNLQRAGLTHSDTKASNFIISDDRVFLIDLDAMVEGTKRRKKDLERFLQNWEAKERGRFEEAFRQAGLV
jgi:tRNA A-37 threonylcarbamoyl transferase component Bud32